MEIDQRPSTHFEERKPGAKPTFLILHYTETMGMGEAEDYFLAKKEHPSGGRVSAHYMIDEKGGIYQYVDESKRAWHAGTSFWGGVEDLNSWSIGIEIVNPGHRFGYRPFPFIQMNALIDLSMDILKRQRGITPFRVLGHSDIAPGRKQDPGELFDWQLLARRGIGVWPVPVKSDADQAALMIENTDKLREGFGAYGYDVRSGLKDVLTAFQRHFHPEVFKSVAKIGQPDPASVARLIALLRMKGQKNPAGTSQ